MLNTQLTLTQTGTNIPWSSFSIATDLQTVVYGNEKYVNMKDLGRLLKTLPLPDALRPSEAADYFAHNS